MTAQDPTALSPAEMLAAGIVLVGYRHPDARVASGGAVWRAHSEYLKANPHIDQVQRSSARRAAMVHLGGHDTLAGLELSRSFPCLGKFLIVDDDGKRPATVECDTCRERLGVSQGTLKADAERAAF